MLICSAENYCHGYAREGKTPNDYFEGIRLVRQTAKSRVIIVIEPETIDWGLELSWELQSKMAEIAGLARKEIEETARDESHWH